ncbi:MAG: hypothetical protein U5L45_24355 [Saprospiraceae bacterium]|nr:hypothetical protein [Saprospiraceae bacterium]
MRALRSRKREETWFVFRRSRKTNHVSSLARAKRARDAKNAFRLCPSLVKYLYLNKRCFAAYLGLTT